MRYDGSNAFTIEQGNQNTENKNMRKSPKYSWVGPTYFDRILGFHEDNLFELKFPSPAVLGHAGRRFCRMSDAKHPKTKKYQVLEYYLKCLPVPLSISNLPGE